MRPSGTGAVVAGITLTVLVICNWTLLNTQLYPASDWALDLLMTSRAKDEWLLTGHFTDQYVSYSSHYGIYHYSNSGVISWYDFATAIAKEAGKNCIVHPIPSSAYPTPANRPGYSVMDCSKLVNDYGIVLKDWHKSLKACLNNLQA